MRRRDRGDGRRSDGRRGAPGRSTRAQTTIDFAVGVGIFLLAVAWVVGTIPQILDPFEAEQDRPLVANRAADSLTQRLLVDDENPDALDAACTEAFFDGDPPPGDCDYGSADPNAATGIDASYGLNVTLSRGGTVVETTGEPVPTTRSVVAARRAILLDGELHELSVRVW
ncbi:hypothetical protein C5B91_04305 [Haloferax sp. Atlit-10N]|uniref:Pilin/flagellin n=1 Tax=Haloferax prahovense (strain DSM 18310 / JCM 13924 / TL6) TaxID=1227461 RepID=M0GL80_HALPT|nr:MULTISPECIES: hypothetical protein [Haloferax]ELZ71594.1 hypothetical protein C457_06086 [Haloferax prahovense DSM 18310]RDZ45830.1 hypothetical protein C5B86_08805 [Haloferax sp. Atlit-19N]RDZ46897.1 hypothetical protein C5B87_04305 [Haloferax sp. Atlit-16N]RDZ60729.1 hypothetical protein C5B91_04305 [Haloferax sp. Atlit-10N]